MKVKVYRNLRHGKHTTPLYSIQHKGKVIDHRHQIVLTGATFKVSESGRQRVLATKRKNVHAFVVGDWCGIETIPNWSGAAVTYNPYKAGHFYYVKDETPCTHAWVATIDSTGIHVSEGGSA